MGWWLEQRFREAVIVPCYAIRMNCCAIFHSLLVKQLTVSSPRALCLQDEVNSFKLILDVDFLGLREPLRMTTNLKVRLVKRRPDPLPGCFRTEMASLWTLSPLRDCITW